ncbi:MAG TPA: membrane dipeptidase [Gemmatimonadaceae bacterium]|nr:membrane dipeptidase [Gemmatimonadaceae bacterium]
MDWTPISRRDFAALLGGGAAAVLASRPVVASRPRVGPRSGGGTWPGYDAALVVDCLATPGPFNVPNMFDAPWTDTMVANARASGIAAVNVTVSGGGGTGAAAFESTVRALAFLEREATAHPDALVRVRGVADIRRAKAERRLGLIPGFQDATMLEGDASRVGLFHGLGVRILQLTYNVRNLVGDGCLEPADAGLSAFGREIVARMNELGMLVDLSHCGRRTTLDAIAASKRPVAFTHSGCAALVDVPRNKTDEQLKRLADRGGVIGIYTMPFLRAAGQPTAADFVRHVEHALRACGEDHVGIGSDNSITPLELTPEFRATHASFVKQRRRQGISAPGEAEEVFNYVPELNTPRRMEQIADLLAARGHPAARIEKLLGANWMRVFGEAWK